jgi:hypothetical protein
MMEALRTSETSVAALMMEAARTSETSVYFHDTITRYMPESCHLYPGHL